LSQSGAFFSSITAVAARVGAFACTSASAAFFCVALRFSSAFLGLLSEAMGVGVAMAVVGMGTGATASSTLFFSLLTMFCSIRARCSSSELPLRMRESRKITPPTSASTSTTAIRPIKIVRMETPKPALEPFVSSEETDDALEVAAGNCSGVSVTCVELDPISRPLPRLRTCKVTV
jgi:hypothetical protein